MNSIELLLNNALDPNTRVKFAQAIMYAQGIIEASWRSQSETQEKGEYTLSKGVAAIIARNEFELPKYLGTILDDLLHNYWNESNEFANSVLFTNYY